MKGLKQCGKELNLFAIYKVLVLEGGVVIYLQKTRMNGTNLPLLGVRLKGGAYA